MSAGDAAKGALTEPDNTDPVVVTTAGGGVAAIVGRRFSRKIAVSVDSARGLFIVTVLARVGTRLGLGGLILLGAVNSLENAIAEGDTRTLSFHQVHTGEDITVTFKRNGRYDEAALKKLDWFMRDWRKEQETQMDPHLFDLLWQVYREVGATLPIDIICGYRSPGTNAMLRARSSGVARYSQHILGHAIDFYIPGVSLEKIREVGLKLQRGGVGFYPTSGSPFVHMDTGTIRHWPRIPRTVLVKIFPDGRTVHIPSDGKPLRNYALALAEVERRGDVPNERSLEAARAAGAITAGEERAAESPTLLAKLFSGGRDENVASEDNGPAPRRARAPTVVASLSQPVAASRLVPLPAPRPKAFALADASSRPAAAPKLTASANNVFDERYWRGAAVPASTLRPAPKLPFDVAAAELSITGSTGGEALAYASEPAPDAASASAPAVKARPMGRRLPRLIGSAEARPAPVNTAALTKSPFSSSMAIGGQHWGSPWLRAAMLTPSVAGFMTMTRMGNTDLHWLRALIDKPARSLLMTFAPDPQYGMVTSRFTGSAVVFLATATFTEARTASLQ
jgi:uncharacterized protein YcbK (DUF882 family)